jgi:hypothetical protein
MRRSSGREEPEVAMDERRRTQMVEEHADLILASEPGMHAYAVYFEAQMRRGKIRRLLYAGYLHWTQSCFDSESSWVDI